ncbi:MAG: extracellular solute-binding protein, partial [Actinomycetales bacterium]|nr:extracellular solute-binding protein [Actinomycetales bacterium]
MVPVPNARPRRMAMLHRGVALTAVSALALAGCTHGGGGESTEAAPADLKCAVQDYAADQQFTSPEPMEVSMLWTDWPENPIKDTWQLFDEIEKRTNVRITTTHIPFSDAVEKRGLLISAGDAPTVIPLVYTGEEQQFAASGAVLPLSDYAEYMPNFEKYVKEWDLTEMIDNLRQSDGRYYMTPGLQEVSVPAFTLIIRKDVFEEVGAPIPETWAELQTGLELIKEAYPDSLPLADGFEGQSMLNYAAHAF